MTPLIQEPAPAAEEVEEFSLRLCYPFAFEASKLVSLAEAFGSRDLRSLVAALPLPPTLRARLENPLSEDNPLPVWKSSARAVSPNLYPHIRRLLRVELPTRDAPAEDDSAKNAPVKRNPAASFELSIEVWQLLTGGWGKVGPGVQIALSKVAWERLGRPTANKDERWMRISPGHGLDDLTPPRLHLFGSGIGVIEIDISPGSEELHAYRTEAAIELTHAITHLGSQAPALRWFIKKPKGDGNEKQQEIEYGASTTLQHVLSTLLGGRDALPDNHADRLEPLLPSRLFSFASMCTAAVLSQGKARNLAQRLAQRQTQHYLPTAAVQRKRTVMFFENIAYSFSTEGGAVVIGTARENQTSINFAKNYIGSVVKDSYWPLTLLAFVEFCKLVKLTGDASHQNIDFGNPKKDDLRHLEQFRGDILDFRLNYRYSRASQLSQHNEYYEAWRAAFGNERLLAELTADVEEIDDFLGYQVEQKRLAWDKRTTRTYGYFGIFLSATILVLGLLGSNLRIYANPEVTDPTVVNTVLVVYGLAYLIYLVRKHFESSDEDRQPRMPLPTRPKK